MKIGATTNADRPLEKQLQEAGKIELDFVEIVVGGPNSNLDYLRKNVGEIKNISKTNSLGLFFHLPWEVDIGSPIEECRDGSVRALTEILEFGKRLQVEKAVIHPESGSGLYWDEEPIKEKIIKSLKGLDEVAKESGIELLAENLDWFNLGNFDRIFKETGLNMCLDTGHAKVNGNDEGDIINFLKDNKDRISHLHLNDNRGERDEHVSLGYGDIDFRRIGKALKKMNWERSLSIELYTESPEYLRISKEKVDNWLSS